MASGGVRQASSTKTTSYVQSFLRACGRTHTHIFRISAGEAFRSVVNDPKRRASPRSNYSNQHPLADRPKCSTRVSVEDCNSHDNARLRKSRSQANGAGTPPEVDSTTVGLDAPVLTGPARLVGDSSSLLKTNNPPPEGLSVQPPRLQ